MLHIIEVSSKCNIKSLCELDLFAQF